MMNRSSVVPVIVIACLFSMFLLYQRVSKPSLYTSRSASTDLIFLKYSDIHIDRSMNVADVDAAFYKFVAIRHVACQISEKFGNVGDGGYHLCLAGPYRPKQPCFVYSFGINNDFSFDDAIAKKLNCTVRSFDPSMKVEDHQRSPRAWFYKIGIDGQSTTNDKGWILKTLPDIVKSMNESDVIIDYLKMDVEGEEWRSLTQMFDVGILSQVKQLGLEFHIMRNYTDTDTDTKYLFYMHGILKQLEDQGFQRWYSVMNFYQLKISKKGVISGCYEMVYINTRFL